VKGRERRRKETGVREPLYARESGGGGEEEEESEAEGKARQSKAGWIG
jgi:hypothetical protein